MRQPWLIPTLVTLVGTSRVAQTTAPGQRDQRPLARTAASLDPIDVVLRTLIMNGRSVRTKEKLKCCAVSRF